ncbi:MAG: plasmid mobilization relaxosome protein MobC [Ruminococcus sp.]|nr:plasmid mobilization relaxosome protein MobC [Ruminococcus sp.]
MKRRNKIIKEKSKKVRKVVRFYGTEWEQINRFAKEHCTKLGTYLRYAALNTQPYCYELELGNLLDEMRMISREVNDVAKKFNETGIISASDVRFLEEKSSELSSILIEAVRRIKPKKLKQQL